MVEAKLTIKNETRLHARPASLIVQTVEQFAAQVKLISEGQAANAKSIMGIMSLDVKQNDELIIKAEGEEAEEAVDSLVELIKGGFNR